MSSKTCVIITDREIREMPCDKYKFFKKCVEWGHFRVLGIFWKKEINWYYDILNNCLVINYE